MYQDPPLSPVGEYPAVYMTTKGVKGAAKTSGGAAKKGSKTGKGISAQMSFGMPNLTGGASNTQTLLSHSSSSMHGGMAVPGFSQSSIHSTFGDPSKGMDVSPSPPGDMNDSMLAASETEQVGGDAGADVSMSLETSPMLKEKRGKESKDKKGKGKETAAQGKDAAGSSHNEVSQAVIGGVSTSVGSNEGTLPLHTTEEEQKEGVDTKKRGAKAAAAAATDSTTTASTSAVTHGTTTESATTTTSTTTTISAPPASKARRR